MRILCVCNGGNCRSVATAEVLKGVYGHEAIAIGTYWFSRESQIKFGEWANLVIIVEPYDAALPEPDLTRWKASPLWSDLFDSKRRLIPLGPDKWGHSNWDAIKAAANAALKEAGIV